MPEMSWPHEDGDQSGEGRVEKIEENLIPLKKKVI